jgi:hypothetical protein
VQFCAPATGAPNVAARIAAPRHTSTHSIFRWFISQIPRMKKNLQRRPRNAGHSARRAFPHSLHFTRLQSTSVHLGASCDAARKSGNCPRGQIEYIERAERRKFAARFWSVRSGAVQALTLRLDCGRICTIDWIHSMIFEKRNSCAASAARMNSFAASPSTSKK